MKFFRVFFQVGLVIAGVLILYVWVPILTQEASYQLSLGKNYDAETVILSDDERKFGLLIPSLGIKSKVTPNVDANNPNEYMAALAEGIAQAKDSVFPGHAGTTFLFAHSSVNILDAIKYNSVFYLISHLKNGDDIKVWYLDEVYNYQVNEIKIVDKTETELIYQYQPKNQLVLMTCWPPGTTLKRMIVVAKPI